VVCTADGVRLYALSVPCRNLRQAVPSEKASELAPSRADLFEVSEFPIQAAAGLRYRVLIVHDLGFIDRRQTTARNFVLAFTLIAACALAFVVAFAIRSLLQRWIRLLVGDISSRRFLDDAESSGASLPVLLEVRHALRELEASQRRNQFRKLTPHALQQVVRDG
jgi:hypothetical protein